VTTGLAGSAAAGTTRPHPDSSTSRSVVLGHREGARLAAGHQGVARLTLWTAADRQVGLRLATGPGGTLADAGIDALVVDAGAVVRTLVVAQALTLWIECITRSVVVQWNKISHGLLIYFFINIVFLIITLFL